MGRLRDLQFIFGLIYGTPSVLYIEVLWPLKVLGASEITANLYFNCSISVLGRLRDLQDIFAQIYGTPSTNITSPCCGL